MSKKAQKRANKKLLIRIVVVAAVIVVAVGIGVAVQLMQKKAQDNNSGEDLFTITGGTPLPRSVTEAQELAADGKTDEANKKIGEALAQNPADDAKYELYVQQGVNYQNEGKNAEALAEYRKAEAVRLDFRLARLIGDVAVLLDNKALAIEYYKKAIPLIDPENPIVDAEKKTLEEKIKSLGEQV